MNKNLKTISQEELVLQCVKMLNFRCLHSFKIAEGRIKAKERLIKEYYANGEMSKEDYEVKMKELQDKRKQINL